MTTFSTRARRAALLALSAGAIGALRRRRLDAEPAFLSRRSDRARAGIAGCVEGGAVRAVADVRAGRTTCSSPPATSRAACARRTSTPSTRCPTRAGSPTASAPGRSRTTSSFAAPNVGEPPDPSKWVRDPGEDRPARTRASRPWTPRARPGSSSSIRRTIPEGATGRRRDRDQDLLGARLQPGGIVPDHASIRRTRTIDPKATIRRPNGKRTPFTNDDINAILERVARNKDGTYRVIAGRLLPGKILGGFQYAGTRPDDPNDLVPHEHRRELRALRVFGAWTNLTDLKAANTIDTLVTENGKTRRQALPAGRRLDVRDVQRRPRVGPELRVLLRRAGRRGSASSRSGSA